MGWEKPASLIMKWRKWALQISPLIDELWKSSQAQSHSVDYKPLTTASLENLSQLSYNIHNIIYLPVTHSLIFRLQGIFRKITFHSSHNLLMHLHSWQHEPSFLCSVQLQPPCASLSIQHGAVQAVGEEERRCLHELPPQHRRPPLPLLQGGLLQRHGQTHHPPTRLQR